MGIEKTKDSRSAAIRAIWMPGRPNVHAMIHTMGVKNIPCRVTAIKVAGTVNPMVC